LFKSATQFSIKLLLSLDIGLEEGNINRTVPELQYCVPQCNGAQWYEQLLQSVDCIGL